MLFKNMQNTGISEGLSMIKIILFIVVVQFILACSTSTVSKIQWQGELVKKNEDINYLYWKDGNQFLTQTKDSVTVIVTGFEFENAIYILVSLNSDKNYPLTFFPTQSKIKYTYENENITLQPIRPKNLDKAHFSIFNTLVGGAGRISRLFLNLPVDILLGPEKNEADTPDKIGSEYHDESDNMSKKLFINNHTLFPETNYAGFLVFEYDPKKDLKENTFLFEITVGDEFFATGSLLN